MSSFSAIKQGPDGFHGAVDFLIMRDVGDAICSCIMRFMQDEICHIIVTICDYAIVRDRSDTDEICYDITPHSPER